MPPSHSSLTGPAYVNWRQAYHSRPLGTTSLPLKPRLAKHPLIPSKSCLQRICEGCEVSVYLLSNPCGHLYSHLPRGAPANTLSARRHSRAALRV